MNTSLFKRCTTLLMIPLLLSGCATMPGDPKLRSQAKPFSRSGLQACLVGGLGGSVVANLGNVEKALDGDKVDGTDVSQKALIGALAGCAIAIGANYYLEQRRAEYANEQDRILAELSDLQEENRQLTNLIATARDAIDQDKAAIKRINADIKAKTVNMEAAKQQVAAAKANKAELTSALAGAKKRKAEWEKVAAAEQAAGADVSVLDAEIEAMQSNINTLQTELAALDEFYEKNPLPVTG